MHSALLSMLPQPRGFTFGSRHVLGEGTQVAELLEKAYALL